MHWHFSTMFCDLNWISLVRVCGVAPILYDKSYMTRIQTLICICLLITTKNASNSDTTDLLSYTNSLPLNSLFFSQSSQHSSAVLGVGQLLPEPGGHDVPLQQPPQWGPGPPGHQRTQHLRLLPHLFPQTARPLLRHTGQPGSWRMRHRGWAHERLHSCSGMLSGAGGAQTPGKPSDLYSPAEVILHALCRLSKIEVHRATCPPWLLPWGCHLSSRWCSPTRVQ